MTSIYGEEYQRLLARLREARKAAGLTQTEVARALGEHQSYVSKSESGERRIDPIELKRFAALYRRDYSYFLE